MGSLAAGGAAAMGTGAFTSVNAERTVDVEIAGDANAYLGLTRASEEDGDSGAGQEANAEYVEYDNGELKLVFDQLNDNATTKFDDLFDIVNNGTQDVYVANDDSQLPSGVQVYAENGAGPDSAFVDTEWGNDQGQTRLSPGEELTDIGIKFNKGWNQQDFNLVLIAQAVDEYNGEPA